MQWNAAAFQLVVVSWGFPEITTYFSHALIETIRKQGTTCEFHGENDCQQTTIDTNLGFDFSLDKKIVSKCIL